MLLGSSYGVRMTSIVAGRSFKLASSSPWQQWMWSLRSDALVLIESGRDLRPTHPSRFSTCSSCSSLQMASGIDRNAVQFERLSTRSEERAPSETALASASIPRVEKSLYDRSSSRTCEHATSHSVSDSSHS